MPAGGLSKKYYRRNKASYKKKLRYDAEHQKKPEQVRKRVECGKKRREAKKRGQNIVGKHYDHRTGGFIDAAKNMGAKEKSRVKGFKQSKHRVGKKIKDAK